ncbi:hypothetical protein D3C71_1633130 [compost metagenome]
MYSAPMNSIAAKRISVLFLENTVMHRNRNMSSHTPCIQVKGADMSSFSHGIIKPSTVAYPRAALPLLVERPVILTNS